MGREMEEEEKEKECQETIIERETCEGKIKKRKKEVERDKR